MMCIAKAYHVRLETDWKILWISLLRLCDLLSTYNEPKDREKITFILNQIYAIFNLGLLKGDKFLPNRIDHDELLYEIIRQRKAFDAVNDWCRWLLLFHISFLITVVTRVYKKKNRLQHVTANIDMLLLEVGTEIDVKYGDDSFPSEKEVMQTIKKVFEPKKLKEVDNIETPLEQYLENPNEVTFFNLLIKTFCHQVRNLVNHSFKKSSAQQEQ